MVRLVGSLVRTLDMRAAAPAPKRADDFYHSPAWKALMRSIIAKRGRICEDPNCDGKTHRPGMRVFGDHIVERQDGGADLDESNIMLRCGASHTKKTVEQRAKRMAESF